jgi:hypothetical protein
MIQFYCSANSADHQQAIGTTADGNGARVTATLIPGCRRSAHVHSLFGAVFPFVIEPRIFMTADSLSPSYRGGCWEMHDLSNGGFYMAPETYRRFQVSAANGFDGEMSADAFGVTVCMYVFSLASFDRRRPRLAEVCARQFHWLRDFALSHRVAGAILWATD